MCSDVNDQNKEIHHLNFAHLKQCSQQAAAFDDQFNYCVQVLNDKLYCQRVLRH